MKFIVSTTALLRNLQTEVIGPNTVLPISKISCLWWKNKLTISGTDLETSITTADGNRVQIRKEGGPFRRVFW